MTRFVLPESQLPTAWFNVLPRLAVPLDPPLHPGTRQPVGPDDLAPLFPMALIEQEMSPTPWIDIPGEVLDILRLWRPTPLVRAERLEAALGTPARIYFKDESVSPAGSHKPNSAVPQAFYNKAEGITRLATETGAGQWGSSLAFATAQFGLECKVYMVRASYEQKPYRKVMMELWGADVVPSPIDEPDSPGSLGAAISDAVRDTVGRADTHYALGSVLNHVLPAPDDHRARGEGPAGAGGRGSPRRRVGVVRRRFQLQWHLLPVPGGRRRAARGGRAVVVSDSHRGPLRVRLRRRRRHDPADAHVHARPRLHAAGHPRRWAPLPRRLADRVPAGAGRSGGGDRLPAGQGLRGGDAVRRAEGKIPAPETAHAIRGAIDEALAAKETGEEKVILFNYSGHGHLDLAAYDDYLNGRLIDA